MNTTSRRILLSVAFLATGVALRAPSAQSPSVPGNDPAIRVASNAVIELSVRNNDLIVRGSDRTSAELHADTRDYQLRSAGVNVAVAITPGDNRRSRSRDDMVLLVPHSVRLVIHSGSGDVSIMDMSADVEVHAQSGEIVVHRQGGRAILDALSGDILITEGVGDLRASTVSGDIVAHDIRGTVEVSTTSGDVELSAAQFSRAEIVTNNGDIVLTGALADNANIQITTHSGDIGLRLPEAAKGQLNVSTFRGTVVSDRLTMLPTVERSLTGGRNDTGTRRYEFGGGGSARISVSTFTGDIALVRGSSSRSRREY